MQVPRPAPGLHTSRVRLRSRERLAYYVL